MAKKVLIVEDDREINGLLAEVLSKNGYETVSAYDGERASELLRDKELTLVLMDLMLPGKSGEVLIEEFRRYSKIPVIVLSAKSVMQTRLDVLRLGADDYIIKPFDLNEVLVRMEVVLRRSAPGEDGGEQLKFGGLTMDLSEKKVMLGEETVNLTAKEFMLLRLFMEHPKKVYSKANLYESVWNEPYYYEDNTINVHVSNLRSKLKKAAGRDCIETVWGIGYRLKEE